MWKILIVDDNESTRLLLADVLRVHARCDQAANGRDAFQAYKEAVAQRAPYDLVLLDIAMPEVDGLTFLEMVRAFESSEGVPIVEGIPIIMVTAYDQPFMRAFNMGCDDYILKPIDPDLLVQKIKMKLAGK